MAAGAAQAGMTAPRPARGEGLRAASASASREKAFAAARRHSVRVRRLRGAILVGAVGGVAALVAIAIFDPFGPKTASLSFAALNIEGAKIAMDKPRLSGFRSDGHAYALTAAKALQDAKRPTIVELQSVDGEIAMAGDESLRMTADAGVYDSVRERMELTRNVRIANARYDVRMSSASVDFKTGLYHSDQPVEIRIGGDTRIVADRATAINSGEEMVFEGHVRTTIAPPAAQPKGSAP